MSSDKMPFLSTRAVKTILKVTVARSSHDLKVSFSLSLRQPRRDEQRALKGSRSGPTLGLSGSRPLGEGTADGETPKPTQG